nr:di-heme oxidoredictase family protein [Pelomonas sp. P8]
MLGWTVPEAAPGEPPWVVADASPEAFSHPLPGRADEPFLRGRNLFRRAWLDGSRSAGDGRGLGPLYNRLSCVACHPANGRGRAPDGPDARVQSLLVRLSVPGTGPHGGQRPHPVYGDQFNEEGVIGVPGEGRVQIRWQAVAHRLVDGRIEWLRRPALSFTELGYGPLAADGRRVQLSARVGPAVYGLGLLADVPEAALQALAATPRPDGVRGVLNRVWNPVTGRMEAGRFGWKANTADLTAQVVQAAAGDLGLTSRTLPEAGCGPAQPACRTAAATGDSPELDDAAARDLVAYMSGLAVPAPRGDGEPRIERGRMLFAAARCTACHQPTLPQPAGRPPVMPYTDLLLHDLGAGLADGRPDYRASGRQWRTAPLWGLGLVPVVNEHGDYLHDGRARGLREAVLWHDGEARAARLRFERLSDAEQGALLAFVASR